MSEFGAIIFVVVSIATMVALTIFTKRQKDKIREIKRKKWSKRQEL